MTFGDRLRYLLERSDMTQKEFAKHLNLTPSTLNGYINNYRLPNLLVIVSIAELLHVSTDYLLGYEKNSSTIPLSTEEVMLLGNLRALDREKRTMIFRLTQIMNDK